MDKYTLKRDGKVVNDSNVEVKIETEVPEGDETTDLAAVMGLLTASCQMLQKESREECWQALLPLHRGERKAKEALKVHLLAFKDGDSVEKAKNRLIWIIDQATNELEAEGKIVPKKKE
jgi:hypothetical protein